MSGLITLLGATSTALNADTAAINVTSNNIANVNNDDYSLETVSFQSLGMVETAEGPENVGVEATTQQQSSAVLNALVQLQDSLVSGYTARQSILQQAQAALGESVSSSSGSSSSSTSTTTESGLGAAVDDFFNAFESYAADPTDEGEQESLLQQATVLVDRFQSIDQNLSEVQSSADSQVSSDVTTANNLLQQVATLNTQIGSLEVNSPGSAVDLRDEREAALEQLAGLVPITVTEAGDGEDTVTAGGVTLVSSGSVANSLSYSDGTLSAGSTALSLSSGQIAGTIAASVGPVQSLRDSLDSLAKQIVTSVNSAYNPDDTADGDFFDSGGTTAGTIALDSNLSTSTLTAGTGSGDNSIALAVGALSSADFSTTDGDAIDGTFDEYYANTVSNLGQSLDTADTDVTDQQNVQTIVENQRDSVSGVSLDTEMTNLMTYQKAYQASSEVFQTINSLLEVVVDDLLTTNS